MANPRSRVTLRTLVRGFDEARTRLAVAIQGNDPDEVFIALFAVVAWAGAIGDWFLKSSKAKQNANPPIIHGLWYVRNRVLHYGADGLYQGLLTMPSLFGGAPFGAASFGGGYVVSVWTWKSTRSLPRGKGSVGKSEYKSLLAGRLVTETLDTASVELARRLRGRS